MNLDLLKNYPVKYGDNQNTDYELDYNILIRFNPFGVYLMMDGYPLAVYNKYGGINLFEYVTLGNMDAINLFMQVCEDKK